MPTRAIESDPATEVVRPLHVGPLDAGRPITSDEFATAGFDPPFRYERSGGKLSIMSPEGWEHVATSEPWRDRLGAYALLRPDLVRRVASQAWVRIDADNDRIGDIGVYLVGPDLGLKIPELVPDLIFEFVSPSKEDRRRDYVLKRADYAKIGVREYVIVDRFDRKVTVLSLDGDRYSERIIAADGLYQSPLLPGFELALAEIWPS